MAKVLHGRRKGQERLTPELPSQSATISNDQALHQVTILSKADWEKIQHQLFKKQIEEEQIRTISEEHEQRKNKSKEIVQHWGNTIAGHRQHKLEARKISEQKEEEERRHIDIEESKFQAQQRKNAIDKAKIEQYYQTDRVKGFHYALMMTEVMKEREAQIELKRLKELNSNDKEKDFLAKMQQDYEEALKEEKTKAALRLYAAAENQNFVKTQVLDHQRKKEQAQLEDWQEGEELKKLAMQHKMETERVNQIRTEEKKQLMKDSIQQIEDYAAMCKIQQEKIDEEDDECRLFASAKRKMLILRDEKEKEFQQDKQQRLDNILEMLTAQLHKKIDNEDERIRQAVKELDEKVDKAEAERVAKVKRGIKEQGEHRILKMQEAKEREKKNQMVENEIVRIKKAADDVFICNEEAKRAIRYKDAKKLAKFHKFQVVNRKLKETEERDLALALDKANVELQQDEEKRFQEYAMKIIDECEKGGRNVYPLRKAAIPGHGGGAGPIFEGKGGIRPSYMAMDKSGKQLPHYQRESTNQIKQTMTDVTTKKRLGFVWDGTD